MQKIMFLTDNKSTFENYRVQLVKKLRSFCVVEVTYLSIWGLIKIMLNQNVGIFSSNLRANMLNLLFFRRHKVLILNGMGRYRNRSLFRFVLVSLLRFNKSKAIVVAQNYLEYRFLRRYIQNHLYFQPGSGGLKLPVNENSDNWAIISRDSKILLQRKSIQHFVSQFNIQSLNVYGCTAENKVPVLTMCKTKNFGRVKPENFFKFSSKFFQPNGYGEGFPHTLAHAICSKCSIGIDDRLYLQLGLHLFRKREFSTDGYQIFQAGEFPTLIENLTVETVNSAYVDVIGTHLLSDAYASLAPELSK